MKSSSLLLERTAPHSAGATRNDVAEPLARPFLKWAGGKRALLRELWRYLPRTIDTYYEPFVGGGALFFALVSGPAGRRPFRRAVLGDANAELISCYRTVRSDVSGVMQALAAHQDGEAHFYDTRAKNPARLSDAERAARTIYLNRNGYNGLYRVNRAGQFNVPFGKYAALRTVRADRLVAAARALQDVTLEVGDFADCVRSAGRGDFVYFDPPYVPLSATSDFTAYSEGGFGEAHQQRLATLLRRFRLEKVPALLSNSDCPATRALYKGLPIKEVQVARSINAIASRRGQVSELLVRSFGYPC
jgi:DNA adenine methylase